MSAGVWVVYENAEGGGCDLIFETEADARAYINRPLDKTEQLIHDRYQEWGGKWAEILIRQEHVRFVPWGKCAAEVEA